MSPQIRLVTAEDTTGLAAVRELFAEYAEWLAPFVDHTTIAEELASLPAPFAAPDGGLWLYTDGEAACGCVGLKRHSAGECEVKRLYVRQPYRSLGLGRSLFLTALATACDLNYEVALVSTIPAYMGRAVTMYEDLGFVPTELFEDHTHAEIGISYLRLDMRRFCDELRAQ
jgi:GNAT superfamily N-acetyltransferase